MGFNAAQWIWQNGEFVPWQNATVHVLSHGLHYGSTVFEGIRAYDTPNGAAVFRLTDHLKRLYMSAKIYEMPIPYTLDELIQGTRDVIKANGLGKCYIRPVAFRGELRPHGAACHNDPTPICSNAPPSSSATANRPAPH